MNKLYTIDNYKLIKNEGSNFSGDLKNKLIDLNMMNKIKILEMSEKLIIESYVDLKEVLTENEYKIVTKYLMSSNNVIPMKKVSEHYKKGVKPKNQK